MVWVFSLGGSIVAPKNCNTLVDTVFLEHFYTLVCKFIHKSHRFVIIVGGGAPARMYQDVYKNMTHNSDTHHHNVAIDKIGIAATRLNATFVRELFGTLAEDKIVTNPTADDISFTKPVLIGAGWKPGFSTDLDTVLLAKRFSTKTIINLSNVEKIYTSDPKNDKNAKPLETVSWDKIISMVGDTWQPGMNVPFDPVACKEAKDANLSVITVEGRNLENLENILEGKKYIGTRIG